MSAQPPRVTRGLAIVFENTSGTTNLVYLDEEVTEYCARFTRGGSGLETAMSKWPLYAQLPVSVSR